MTRYRYYGMLLLAAAMLSCVVARSAELAPERASAQQRIDRARSDLNSVILTITRKTDKSARTDDFLYKECGSWMLSKDDIRAFFAAAKPISPEEVHLTYYSVPCNYYGALTSNGQVYEYRINGGLHGYMREVGDGEWFFYFGCKEKCARLTPFDLYGGTEEP